MTTDTQREALQKGAVLSKPVQDAICLLRMHDELAEADALEEYACAAQTELTELRAIVARLREPVSFKHSVEMWGISQASKSFRAALTAHNKHILGETE